MTYWLKTKVELKGGPKGSAYFDPVDTTHSGPNTMHMIKTHLLELILKFRPQRVLDLPCGRGGLTQMLVEKGISVVSADLHPEKFLVPGHSCMCVDLNKPLPFKDREFGVIVCVEGIEHIENPHLMVREANRILHPGGRIFISTPNVLSIRSRLSNLFRGYPNQFHYMIEVDSQTGKERPLAHINPIGFLELRYVLSRWGFRVDYVHTNREYKKWSPFYRLLRLVLLTRGKKSVSHHLSIAEVRKGLLSDPVLFGENLIVGATKVTDYRNQESPDEMSKE